MKFAKSFLLVLALVFVASVAMVAAEDATVNPYTFTIPDGYTIATSDDTTCAMQKDNFNAISFATGVGEDLEAAKQTFISQGKTLIDEKNMTYEDMDITLQAFSAEADGTTLYVYNYIMFADQGNFVVTVTTDNADFDSDLNSADNPAKVIFDSVQAN